MFFFIWIFFVSMPLAKGQQERLIQLEEQPVAWAVDALGNAYLMSESGSIVRYDSTGNMISTPVRRSRSSNWQIDASNPHKIIVFNRDFQEVYFFSSELSLLSTIHLEKVAEAEFDLFCGSYDNGFWGLTSEPTELIRFSDKLQVTVRTSTSLLRNQENAIPFQMMESGSKVLLAYKNQGANLFDLYGNLIMQFPATADCYSLQGDIIYYMIEGRIVAYHSVLHKEEPLLLPEGKIKGFQIISGRVAIMYEKALQITRLTFSD